MMCEQPTYFVTWRSRRTWRGYYRAVYRAQSPHAAVTEFFRGRFGPLQRHEVEVERVEQA